MTFELAHMQCLRQASVLWACALPLWFLRARTRKYTDAQTYSFFRDRRRSVQSLAKMFTFLKTPSFTLFTMGRIRGTW